VDRPGIRGWPEASSRDTDCRRFADGGGTTVTPAAELGQGRTTRRLGTKVAFVGAEVNGGGDDLTIHQYRPDSRP
jgi:hypothetical protein